MMTIQRTAHPAPQSVGIRLAFVCVSVALTDATVCKPPGLGSSASENNEGHSRLDGFVDSRGAGY